MNVQEEAEKLKQQWNQFFEEAKKPCQCIFCNCMKLFWNGRRERSASVLIGDQTVHLIDIVCRRIKCFQCKKSWTIRPEGLMPGRHYQLCVITHAASRFLFDSDATLSKVADIYKCARRTVGRWLKWIADIAKPSELICRLFAISKKSMDRVEKVKDIENKIAHTGAQFFKRAGRNLLILQALSRAIGYPGNGFQSMVECAIFNRTGITTYGDPFIPELAR